MTRVIREMIFIRYQKKNLRNVCLSCMTQSESCRESDSSPVPCLRSRKKFLIREEMGRRCRKDQSAGLAFSRAAAMASSSIMEVYLFSSEYVMFSSDWLA